MPSLTALAGKTYPWLIPGRRKEPLIPNLEGKRLLTVVGNKRGYWFPDTAIVF